MISKAKRIFIYRRTESAPFGRILHELGMLFFATSRTGDDVNGCLGILIRFLVRSIVHLKIIDWP